MTVAVVEAGAARAPVLGLRANAAQFSLLVLVNAFVGAMVGMERSILAPLAEVEFGLTAHTAVLSFIVAFGLSKAFTNYAAGRLSDRVGRKRVLVGGWIVAAPVPFLQKDAHADLLIVVPFAFPTFFAPDALAAGLAAVAGHPARPVDDLGVADRAARVRGPGHRAGGGGVREQGRAQHPLRGAGAPGEREACGAEPHEAGRVGVGPT